MPVETTTDHQYALMINDESAALRPCMMHGLASAFFPVFVLNSNES